MSVFSTYMRSVCTHVRVFICLDDTQVSGYAGKNMRDRAVRFDRSGQIFSPPGSVFLPSLLGEGIRLLATTLKILFLSFKILLCLVGLTCQNK